MTVRIYPAPYRHPVDCALHDGPARVAAAPVGSTVGVVIPCPHCTSAAELRELVGLWERQTPPRGGAA